MLSYPHNSGSLKEFLKTETSSDGQLDELLKQYFLDRLSSADGSIQSMERQVLEDLLSTSGLSNSSLWKQYLDGESLVDIDAWITAGGFTAATPSLVLNTSSIQPPNAVSFKTTTNNTNTIHVVVTPSSEGNPSEAQIIAGQNSSGSAATKSDTILTPSIGQISFMIGDLDYRTSYKVHLTQNGVVVRSGALDLSLCTELLMMAGGQSNVQGNHALTGTGFPANNRGWNGTAWVTLTGGNANPNSSNVGPPLGFAQAFAADFPLIALYWVAASQTGTALSGISKGTSIFDDAVTDINAQLIALGSGAFFGGVIMHHGEANANPTGIVDYVTELPQYMADVETDITGANEFHSVGYG